MCVFPSWFVLGAHAYALIRTDMEHSHALRQCCPAFACTSLSSRCVGPRLVRVRLHPRGPAVSIGDAEVRCEFVNEWHNVVDRVACFGFFFLYRSMKDSISTGFSDCGTCSNPQMLRACHGSPVSSLPNSTLYICPFPHQSCQDPCFSFPVWFW